MAAGAAGSFVDTLASNTHNSFSSASRRINVHLQPVNDIPTGGVSISGQQEDLGVGDVLRGVATDLADEDGLGPLNYFWRYQLDNGNYQGIENAASQTYTLTAIDAGQSIVFGVSYIDQGGTLETVLSDVFEIPEVLA